MTFTEKLTRLTAEQSKKRIAKAAGLPNAAISNYISKKQMPRGDKALALARALEVPVEWLLDDEQDEWPAPKIAKPSIAAFSDDELMMELARRYRHAIVEFLDAARIAEKIDWPDATRAAKAAVPTGPFPPIVKRAVAAFENLELKHDRMQQAFDLHVFSTLHHEELPGGELSLQEIDRAAAGFAFGTNNNKSDVQEFALAAGAKGAFDNSDARKALRRSYATMIEYEKRMRPENFRVRKPAQP